MWCKRKTNITFVPLKCRQTCLKMTFVGGKCGSYVIFKQGEYIFGFVGNILFKILQFLDSVCCLACSKVLKLTKLFLIQINILSMHDEKQI